MKATIKIHDTRWFRAHCRVTAATIDFADLKPKYDSWRHKCSVSWMHGLDAMSPLEGCVLEVECDSGNEAGDMSDARYMAGGYWIPNWAIEWVKEEVK